MSICRGIYPPRKVTSPTERFWKYVEPMMDDRGCWEWTGAVSHWGYGKIVVRNNKLVRAHRVSWEIHNGPIPEGMCVLHRCDNPPCVNPSHLFLGTLSDNTRDMRAKGRGNDTVAVMVEARKRKAAERRQLTSR